MKELENMTIFDFLEDRKPEPFECDTCKHDVKGCCDYDEPLGRHCVLGSAYKESREDDDQRRRGEDKQGDKARVYRGLYRHL